MSLVSRTSSLQAYHLVLYRKAVHPEFFGIEGRRRLVHGDYEFEGWIFRGGHTFLFHFQGLCAAEIVTDRLDGLPDRARVVLFPCAGERDHEDKVAERIGYVTSVQTETLTDHLYNGTFQEMIEHARAGESLMTTWKDTNGVDNMSLIDVQRFRNEIHAQSYHLRSDCGLVLRTQTIFRSLAMPVKKLDS